MEITDLIYKYLSQEKSVNTEIIKKKLQEFSDLEIIRTLALYFTEDDVIIFAKKYYDKPDGVNIRTIGTFYYRMYNGGTEKVVSLLSACWLHMGYNVVLYTDQEINQLDYELPAEVKRIKLKHPCNQIKNKEDIYIRVNELYNRIKEDKIDVMIYHAWQEPHMIWDIMATKGAGIPFILYAHGVFATIYHYIDQNTFRWPQIYRLCDRIVCLTKVSKEYYRQLGCNTTCVQNPIDSRLDNVERASLDGQDILWIGRLSEEKRPMDALKVFERVSEIHKNAELFIVGDGSKYWAELLEKTIREKKWEDRVHLCGYQQDVDKYYKRAAVMMLTSDFEGYCLTLLESKAYGVPCVMYELPYLSLVEDRKGIECVEVGKIDAMAERISYLLSDKSYRKESGNMARESYVSNRNYDLEKQWKNIFENVEKESVEECRNTAQQMMLDLLLEHTEIGLSKCIAEKENRLEMRIGRKMIFLPKKIWDFCWRICHR